MKDSNAEVTIISEANTELNNTEEMHVRNVLFSEYCLEDKGILHRHNSRIKVTIKNGLPIVQCRELESDNNSTMVLKFKENEVKSLYLIGSYHQWQHFGDPKAKSSEGINQQIVGMTQPGELISNIKLKSQNNSLIWAVDLNVDKNPCDDNSMRPDLRLITPIFGEIIDKKDLAQLKLCNMWHRLGKESLLLDIFYTDKPQRAKVPNIPFVHEGVRMEYNFKANMKRKQFFTKQNYQFFT